jgi:hypothetical protein
MSFSCSRKNILIDYYTNKQRTITYTRKNILPLRNFDFLLKIIRYAFADILESERSYVADLQRIIEIYLYELTRQECPWFVKEKKDLLFSNIEDIFAFHKV